MGFFGTRYFHANPYLGLFNLAIAVYGTVAFLALYDHAFAIPRKALELKRRTSMQLQLFFTKRGRRVRGLRFTLESVPELGIKLGGFNFLERESTPIFLEYVTNRVAGLLMTFH